MEQREGHTLVYKWSKDGGSHWSSWSYHKDRNAEKTGAEIWGTMIGADSRAEIEQRLGKIRGWTWNEYWGARWGGHMEHKRVEQWGSHWDGNGAMIGVDTGSEIELRLG